MSMVDLSIIKKEDVEEAIKKQNNIIKNRCVIKKLKERGISLFEVIYNSKLIPWDKKELYLEIAKEKKVNVNNEKGMFEKIFG